MDPQALAEHVEPLQRRRKKAAQNGAVTEHTAQNPKSDSRAGSAIELRLALRGALFRMDHHPMEVTSHTACDPFSPDRVLHA